MLKKIVFLFVIVISLNGCGSQETIDVDNVEASILEIENKTDMPVTVLENHPVVVISFDDFEPMVFELYPEVAENTVNNFIALVEKGFYDGLTFHKIVEGFMIQGGDPSGNGTGGPGYTIQGEFYQSGQPFNQYISHTRGTLSMARASDPDSAGSQFFIVQEAHESLDLQFAAFGRIVSGIESLDQIAGVPVNEHDIPEVPIIIKKMTVDLNGYQPLEPVVMEEE